MLETRHAPPGALDIAARPDLAAVFGRVAPLEVEIGSGRGGFALGQAASHPEIDLVAIEVRRAYAAETAAKGKARGLRNLLVLQADAKAVLPRLFAPRSLSRIHVQFPDPWWKRRHHERRLVEDDFSVLLYALLRLDGTLNVRTDVEARGREMAAVLEAVGFVCEAGPEALSALEPGYVPSTRERVYLSRGQPVFRWRFGRTEAPPRRAGPLGPSAVGPQHRRR